MDDVTLYLDKSPIALSAGDSIFVSETTIVKP